MSMFKNKLIKNFKIKKNKQKRNMLIKRTFFKEGKEEIKAIFCLKKNRI